MDESGNTQEIAALALVSIKKEDMARIKEILTIKKSDPEEIKTLYHSVSEGEFKYSAFRLAYAKTKLEVYDIFLRNKLNEINTLDLEVYYSIFRTPKENEERIERLRTEAAYLFHKWSHNNPLDALDKGLSITIDQQIFPAKYIFQHYIKRNRGYTYIIREDKIKQMKKNGILKEIFADKSNTIEIRDGNSKTCREIQVSDLFVGSIREKYIHNDSTYHDLIRNKIKKDGTRVQLDSYAPPQELKYLGSPTG